MRVVYYEDAIHHNDITYGRNHEMRRQMPHNNLQSDWDDVIQELFTHISS